MRVNGQKIEAEIEEKIEDYIDSDEELPLAEREGMGNVVDYAAGRNRYIGYLMTILTRAFNGYCPDFRKRLCLVRYRNNAEFTSGSRVC